MKITIDPQINQFLQSVSVEKGLAKNTIISYEQDLINAQNNIIGNKLLSKINSSDVQFLLSIWSKKLSRRSQSRKLSSLKQFMNWLRVEKKRTDNIFNNVVSPKIKTSLPNVLSENQVKRLLKFADYDKSKSSLQLLCILEILYSTGLRVSELISLPLSGMEKNPETIIVKGKGGKQRLVALNNSSRVAIKRWLYVRHKLKYSVDSIYLFPSKKFGFISRQSLSHQIKILAQKAGIMDFIVTPHTLRHAFASHMLNRGANLRTIQIFLGHASISTTQIYTHTQNDRLSGLVNNIHPLANKSFSD